VRCLPPITAALTALGRDPREPALLVERAATPQQRIVPASLGDIANAARDARIESPAVLITGPTVGAATAPIAVARALAPAASAVAVYRARLLPRVPRPARAPVPRGGWGRARRAQG